MERTWEQHRKRVFDIIEVGSDLDHPSRVYDFVNAFSIVLNLIVSIMFTFEGIREQYGTLLRIVEASTVAFFGIDYILRVWTSKYLHPELTEWHSLRKYVLSFTGLVDLFSFLPYYLPVFFPKGAIAVRMFRIVRIFRLFRINAYYDSLNVITEVISDKKQQLFSSVFLILILMIASSLCMYSIEHEAQPTVFTNAFSGVWWAASSLLTVGYGDIYPITTIGKLFGIFITFLGVGMVAIPTGIISAGFVEQYANIKRKSEYGYEAHMRFIKILLTDRDKWAGKTVAELELPAGVILAAIRRKERVLIARGSTILKSGDTIILGARPFKEDEHIVLKEIILEKQNPWVGEHIRDLDISRHSIIVLIRRKNKTIIPNGNTVLREGDNVFLYTELHFTKTNEIEL